VDIKEKDFSICLSRITDSIQGGFTREDLKEMISSRFVGITHQQGSFLSAMSWKVFLLKFLLLGLSISHWIPEE
jgi:hypothetical protein